jgi:hypothetical protein
MPSLTPRALALTLGLSLELACTGGAGGGSGGPARAAAAGAPGREVTLLVHGYRGGSLLTQGERPETAYLTVGQALGLSGHTLARPFPGMRPLPTLGALRPGGPLTRITVVPGVAQREIYGGFLSWGAEQLPGGLEALAYDWRGDLREASRALCEAKDRALAAGATRVNVVAHSMGGLVTLHCLRTGGGLPAPAGGPRGAWAGARGVGRVVFAGVPFAGAPGVYDDFVTGVPTGLNRQLLSPAAVFTFTAAFQLLPPAPDFFVDAEGRPHPAPAYQADFWRAQGWGPFADAALREDAAYRAHLEAQLAAHAALWADLRPAAGEPPAPFPSLVVVGTGRKAVQAYRMAEGRLQQGGEVKGESDGSVLVARARPPPELAARVVETGAEHEALLDAPDVRAALLGFLRP